MPNADEFERIARLNACQAGKHVSGWNPSQDVARWLTEAAVARAAAAFALESLAWTHRLSGLSAHLPAADWWALLSQLIEIAEAVAAGKLVDPWPQQLLAAELPLTLAYLFPELERCRVLAARGLGAARQAMEELLDAEGMLHARHLHLAHPLLACWTRIYTLAHELVAGEPSADKAGKEAGARFERFVRQALRLTYGNGTAVLAGQAGKPAATIEMFESALRFSKDIADKRLASVVLAGPRNQPAAPQQAARLPAPAVYCEPSQVAVLRPSWSSLDERLTVAFADGRFCCELAAGGQPIWSGGCQLEIEHRGERLTAVSDWEEVCWASDADADYLELEILLSGGVRVQRHLLLAREDHFLFAADAILADGPGPIRYQSRWPLAEGIQFEPQAETREAFLAARRRRGLVLPLALAEWRTDPRGGELETVEEPSGRRWLQLRQATPVGRALFAPLFIDLSPRRLSRPATWRRLTVAECRVVQPPDVAVGYRVQVGGQQWMFYRSLGERGNRTLIGHNLVTEFLAARLNSQGKVETLMEIE